ncbi:hypothetical protein D3C78_1372140 [compost metagenome]
MPKHMHRLTLALDQLDQIGDMLLGGEAIALTAPVLWKAMTQTRRQHPAAISQHRDLRRPETVVAQGAMHHQQRLPRPHLDAFQLVIRQMPDRGFHRDNLAQQFSECRKQKSRSK